MTIEEEQNSKENNQNILVKKFTGNINTKVKKKK